MREGGREYPNDAISSVAPQLMLQMVPSSGAAGCTACLL